MWMLVTELEADPRHLRAGAHPLGRVNAHNKMPREPGGRLGCWIKSNEYDDARFTVLR